MMYAIRAARTGCPSPLTKTRLNGRAPFGLARRPGKRAAARSSQPRSPGSSFSNQQRQRLEGAGNREP